MSKPAPFKPIARGPQKGAPPSLEFVALDRLEVDPAYQRATDGPHSRKIVVGMVKAWDWALCQPLVVSRRPDGRMMILDGQHRHAGAKERGDIAHLPCVVLSGIDEAGEARSFVDLNTRRQRLGQADIFHGMLAAGDEEAKQTAALIRKTGWRVVRSSATDGWKPGDLHCAPMLARQVKTAGPAHVRGALETLRAAYPETTVTCSATLLQALIAIFRKGLNNAQRAGLAPALAAAEPNTWIHRGQTRRGRQPDLSTIAAIAVVIEEAAALGASPKSTPPPASSTSSAPKVAPPPAAAGKPAGFGTSGKGWCDQCEQLVDRGQAAACRSTFCKLKAAA